MLVRLGQRCRPGLTVQSLARIGRLQAEVRGHRVNHDTFMMMGFLNGSGFLSSITCRSDPNREQGRRGGTAVVF